MAALDLDTHFRRPPIAEMVLSIQFDDLPNLNIGHLGLIWNQFRDRYPRSQQMMPLPPIFEQFGLPQIVNPQVQITVGTSAVPITILPRLWFLTQDESELIQVQQGRFIHNWRRKDDEQEYPSYETLKAKFRDELSEFLQFIEREQLGTFNPNQCELIYVNLISLGTGIDTHQKLAGLTGCWRDIDAEVELESANLSAHYLIPGSGQGPGGRLHATWTPVLRNGDKAYQFEILVRGAPKGAGVEGVFHFFHNAHESALRAFLSMTTAEMQGRWEKILAA